MNWPYLTRNVARILLVIVILGGLLFVALISPIYRDQVQKMNYGFGPEWDCIYLPKVGPFCTKRAVNPDKPN
jgi:hypothetical protein